MAIGGSTKCVLPKTSGWRVGIGGSCARFAGVAGLRLSKTAGQSLAFCFLGRALRSQSLPEPSSPARQTLFFGKTPLHNPPTVVFRCKLPGEKLPSGVRQRASVKRFLQLGPCAPARPAIRRERMISELGSTTPPQRPWPGLAGADRRGRGYSAAGSVRRA